MTDHQNSPLTQSRTENERSNMAAALAQCWLGCGCLILDTETTGLGDDAEIVEIAVIDSEGRVLLDTLVKPVNPIPAEATAIHGITNEMVQDAESWPYVYGELIGLLNKHPGSPLVIYNAEYDLRLIRQTSALHNGGWVRAMPGGDERALCAMLVYADFWGEPGRYGDCKWQKLTVAAQQQGVKVEGAHRALADCKMTLGVVKAMAGSAA